MRPILASTQAFWWHSSTHVATSQQQCRTMAARLSAVPRSILRLPEATIPLRTVMLQCSGSRSPKFFSTTARTPPTDDDGNSKVVGTQQEQQQPAGTDVVVYESPLGNLVTRLRTVSLATGICGTLGLPLVVAIKGGDLPSSGLLAFGMAFVTGSLGSTAAIHFVFLPYVYTIERIPVRLCHYKGKAIEEARQQCQGPAEPSIPSEKMQELEDQVASSSASSVPRDFLYKAVSRSLFLTRIETVFNPETDVAEYKGYKPLCNFVVKDRPLYVHPEYLYNAQLRLSMNLNSNKASGGATVTKENPDDFL